MIITGLAGTTPQDLDLETMQLLLHFFTVEELVNELQLVDLSIRELTFIKSAVLQEIATQIVGHTALRGAVRARVQLVSGLIRPPRR